MKVCNYSVTVLHCTVVVGWGHNRHCNQLLIFPYKSGPMCSLMGHLNEDITTSDTTTPIEL
jgi:hypothetical protein